MAYTFRAAGSIASSSNGSVLATGDPAGKTSGDLLLGLTCQRTSAAQTVAALADWTQLGVDAGTRGSIEVWARIADGTAADSFAPDWSGTTHCLAWVEAWYGDVYSDLSTIVAHSAGTNSSSANLVLPSVTGTTVDNCLVIAFSRKNNTAADATAISHASLTVRTQRVSTVTGQQHAAAASSQQTTSADFDGTDFTVDGTSESLASNGIVLYLKSAEAAPSGGLVLPTMYRKPNVLLRM